MPADGPAKFSLNRLSLGYDDPRLEADYQSYQPVMLSRTLKPLLIVMIPIVALLGLIDLLSLAEQTLIPWQGCAILVVAFPAIVVLMSVKAGTRFIQPGLLITFVLFGCSLLMRVSDANDLRHYFPGYFIMIMLSHFIGLRFTYGLAAAATLLAALVAVILGNHIGLMPFLQTGVFFVPGYIIAATAGYAMERQRRRLFAQVKIMEMERNEHEQMALHDPLTALPNRNLLRERMHQSLARSQRQHGQFAVLFVDLDDFKSVNDSYGHRIGDQVLKQIAVNLEHQVRGEDTVARLGGDEFVVLSEHIDDEHGARIAAERIQAAVSTPIIVQMAPRDDTIHIHLTCSIGIALCPRDGDTLDELIGHADEAMYKAKRGGKGNAKFFRDQEDLASGAEQSAR